MKKATGKVNLRECMAKQTQPRTHLTMTQMLRWRTLPRRRRCAEPEDLHETWTRGRPPPRSPSPLRWVDSQAENASTCGARSGHEGAAAANATADDPGTAPTTEEPAHGELGEGQVAGSAGAAHRDMRAFDDQYRVTMEEEMRRLRRELSDTRSEAQKDAARNRAEMEALVRKLTAEHIRQMADKPPFPFAYVTELPSSIRPSSFQSDSTSSKSSNAGNNGRRGGRVPPDERKRNTDNSGNEESDAGSDSDSAPMEQMKGATSRPQARDQARPTHASTTGAETTNGTAVPATEESGTRPPGAGRPTPGETVGGAGSHEPEAEHAGRVGGKAAGGASEKGSARAANKQRSERAASAADAGTRGPEPCATPGAGQPAQTANEPDCDEYSGDADRELSDSSGEHELAGDTVEHKSRPGVGAADPADSTMPDEEATDGGTAERKPDGRGRHAGEPKEPEPKATRSDDVTMAKVLSHMTDALLRSSGKSDNKQRKRPTCKRVPTITDPVRLQNWRDHRQWYLREVRLYNKVPGVIPMEPVPVIELTARSDWRAISEWELDKDHRTQPGDDPNDTECANWLLGNGRYEKPVNRVRGTQAEMIKAVRWPKVTTGSTHLDRFYSYANSLGKVMRKIPSAQITKHTRKAQVAALRKDIKPAKLWRLVHNAIEGGQDGRADGLPTYNKDWHDSAYGDPDMALGIVRSMCRYLDALIGGEGLHAVITGC